MQSPNSLCKYRETENPHYVLLSLTFTFRPSYLWAFPFIVMFTVATFVLSRMSILQPLLVLRTSLKARNNSLLRRYIQRDFRPHRCLPWLFSSCEQHLLRHRAVHHLIPAEHSSVIKSLQTLLPRAWALPFCSTIFHLLCYSAVHGLNRKWQ